MSAIIEGVKPFGEAVDIRGQVRRDGTATLLTRALNGVEPITQADIASAKYTIHLLDDSDADDWTPIDGHTDVAVPVADLIFDTLQTDALWTVDATGYNFRHTLDVSTSTAFAIAGRSYLIVFELTPASGQVVLIRFRVQCV